MCPEGIKDQDICRKMAINWPKMVKIKQLKSFVNRKDVSLPNVKNSIWPSIANRTIFAWQLSNNILTHILTHTGGTLLWNRSSIKFMLFLYMMRNINLVKCLVSLSCKLCFTVSDISIFINHKYSEKDNYDILHTRILILYKMAQVMYLLYQARNSQTWKTPVLAVVRWIET